MSIAHTCAFLHANWSWAERDLALAVLAQAGEDAGWTRATRFPSEVHVELLAAGRILDPYIGFGEHEVQWVGEREWLYRCAFDVDTLGDAGDVYRELVFDGLDTVCDVYLNGALILQADNQHRAYTIKLASSSLKSKDNTLLLHFKSAQKLAKQLEAQHGTVRAGSTNLGDPSRVYVRKAQYDWRWDWGPELMTAGPYRPITLHTYTARIADAHARAHVDHALRPALGLHLLLRGAAAAVASVRVALRDVKGRRVREEEVDMRSRVAAGQPANADAQVELRDVIQWDLAGAIELWWPAGSGAQPLYDVQITLLAADGEVLDETTQRTGFRRVRLIQEPLEQADRYGKGTTFLFEVNGVRIFMGGSNWIPADNFLTTISDARYRAWLELARDGGQNMVRVWGGGIYEPDIFYDLCDELGLLVWTDFGFACGVYPAHAPFVAAVRAEAADVLRRVRRHPCLGLFCGNNEDYQQVLQWGDVPDLPARVIYENVLPTLVDSLTRSAPLDGDAGAAGQGEVNENTGAVPYHRGSPYGGKGWDTADPTVGDVHQWDIWAGAMRPWQEYDVRGGRFVSEFGIPSLPDLRTIDYWLGPAKDDTEERRPQGAVMGQHCRAGGAQRRFGVLLGEDFRHTEDLETYAFNTQVLQSEAMAFAYRSWRREWRGPGKQFTGGVLVWQLNDCWPVTSWAIVDYFLRPKPAYYTIARELGSITVGISRTVIKNRPDDRLRQYYERGAYLSASATIDIWATNSTLEPRRVALELRFIDLHSGEDTQPQTVLSFELAPNATTELVSGMAFPQPAGTTGAVAVGSTTVVSARLLVPDTLVVLARAADFPQPFRALAFPDPVLDLNVAPLAGDDGVSRVRVSVRRPVKTLVLGVADDAKNVDGAAWSWDGDWEARCVKWSDNALDVVPGDEQVVRVQGLRGRPVTVAYMGSERARAM